MNEAHAHYLPLGVVVLAKNNRSQCSRGQERRIYLCYGRAEFFYVGDRFACKFGMTGRQHHSLIARR